MKNLLKQHNEIIEQIHVYFGYNENWTVLPIDDSTQYYWKLTESGVQFYENQDDDDDNSYDNEFLNGSVEDVYRTEAYTMIVVDTHCDGNKFLQIFDNSKELK